MTLTLAKDKILELGNGEGEQLTALRDLRHPVTAYLSGLAASSRRTQLAALEAIARRATSVYCAETMPWHRLRRPHVLRIRQLLEDHYQPATGNRMLAALRGVLRESWHLGLMSAADYQAAASVQAVRGQSEPRGRDLSAGDLRGLFEACARAPREPAHRQDSGSRRRRDAALLALVYGCGLRRAEAVSLDVEDVDLEAGRLHLRRGKGRKPRQAAIPPSAVAALQEWLHARGSLAGPLFCAVLKTGRLVSDQEGHPRRLSASAAWALVKERGVKAGIRPPSPHDFRRTWIGDLLEAGVDLATVQKMAGHASVSTTGRYDRRDNVPQQRAAAELHVPYVVPED